MRRLKVLRVGEAMSAGGVGAVVRASVADCVGATMRAGVVAGVCVLLALGACKPIVPSRKPPVAEFLLAAGDSTYWIRSGPEGMRVRSAPIFLTYADNHFYEVFISDNVHDFAQASFANARAFRRDIMRDDSLMLFEDATVPREARAWMRTHPEAAPIDPDDGDATEAPATLVTDDIEVIDVHGPWLTFGHALDVDVAGRSGHLHRRRHGVLDVRTGARGTVATLFGESESARVSERARIAFQELRDSVQRSTDERSEAARRALTSFVFDSTSFGITDIARVPAVAFLVPGIGAQGEALSLFLPPITVSEPAWWSAVATTLPQWNGDSTALVWLRRGYDVQARPSEDGELLILELVDRSNASAPRSWPIATVQSPAYQMIPLDITPLDSSTRVALARAFDQSSVLNGAAQQASLSPHRSSWPLLRAVNSRAAARRTLLDATNVRSTCCTGTRRVCGHARAELSPLHHMPARTDIRHTNTGYSCRMAGL